MQSPMKGGSTAFGNTKLSPVRVSFPSPEQTEAAADATGWEHTHTAL
jgi:hypothetical protein